MVHQQLHHILKTFDDINKKNLMIQTAISIALFTTLFTLFIVQDFLPEGERNIYELPILVITLIARFLIGINIARLIIELMVRKNIKVTPIKEGEITSKKDKHIEYIAHQLQIDPALLRRKKSHSILSPSKRYRTELRKRINQYVEQDSENDKAVKLFYLSLILIDYDVMDYKLHRYNQQNDLPIIDNIRIAIDMFKKHPFAYKNQYTHLLQDIVEGQHNIPMFNDWEKISKGLKSDFLQKIKQIDTSTLNDDSKTLIATLGLFTLAANKHAPLYKVISSHTDYSKAILMLTDYTLSEDEIKRIQEHAPTLIKSLSTDSVVNLVINDKSKQLLKTIEFHQLQSAEDSHSTLIEKIYLKYDFLHLQQVTQSTPPTATPATNRTRRSKL